MPLYKKTNNHADCGAPTMTLVIVKTTEKRVASALWQSLTSVSPFSRRRFILTYQFVSSSTNFTSRGTTVYRRYAAVQQQRYSVHAYRPDTGVVLGLSNNKFFLLAVISFLTSGYAMWFTAGGAIRIAHYDVIDDIITRKL